MRDSKGRFKSYKRTNLNGKRFGSLIVIKDSMGRKSRKVIWECKCDCGNFTYIVTDSLTSGNTKSCGCGLIRHYEKHIHSNPTFIDGTELGLLSSEVKFAHNTSGYRGVSFNPKTKKYRAYIQFKKKQYNLGTFSDLEKAVKARKLAEEKFYKPILEKNQELLKKGID